MTREGTRRAVRAVVASAVLAIAACTPALREPPPVTAPGGVPRDQPVYELLRDAEAAWARRADLAEARRAADLYQAAAAADDQRVEGLLGAMRAKIYLAERERSAGTREQLAVSAVQDGQWCQRRAYGNVWCDYLLAEAIGQQARERHSTAKDAMQQMVKLLDGVIARAPAIDGGGPHRVLALLLLRAPGWPVGPGDPEKALAEARAAVAVAPDRADNQVVLGEALRKNGDDAGARAAYERGRELAEQAVRAGDPEAGRWLEDARKALVELGGSAAGGRAD